MQLPLYDYVYTVCICTCSYNTIAFYIQILEDNSSKKDLEDSTNLKQFTSKKDQLGEPEKATLVYVSNYQLHDNCFNNQ